jgi:hypothetical protein
VKADTLAQLRATNRRALGALVLCVVFSLSAPLAWLAHGMVRHHDPFFFFSRVAAYHQAIGGRTLEWFDALRSQLGGLLFEPEALAAVAVLAVIFIVRSRQPHRAGGALTDSLRGWGRFWVALLAILVFRIVSEHTGGVPTHHAERTLLPLWLGLLLFGGALARSILNGVRESERRRLAFGVGGLLLLTTISTAALLRPRLPAQDLQSRLTEVTMGRLAQDLVPKHERLAVCTKDYGYFAVEAAFGHPELSLNLCDRDPRHDIHTDPLKNRETMLEAMRAKKSRYLIAPLDALPPAERKLTVLARREELVLVRLPHE